MKRTISAVLLMVNFIAFPADAAEDKPGPESGNFWLDMCSTAQTRPECIFYVFGATRGFQAQAALDRAPAPFCLPTKLTYEQLADIFLKYLKDHPESRHQEASTLLLLALNQAYPPCK